MVNTRMTDDINDHHLEGESSMQLEMGKILSRVGRVLNGYKQREESMLERIKILES